MKKERTPEDVANIIDRFLNGLSLYPQEWNDFVECREADPELDKYRKRCSLLDLLVNSPDSQDDASMAELRGMVAELRRIAREAERCE